LPCQPDGFLGDWDASGHKCPCNDIVQSLMSGDSTGSTFADEGMRATGIHLSATAVGVWNANVSPQSQTNRDTNGLVIETEAARHDGSQGMKSIATMWDSSSPEAGLLLTSDNTRFHQRAITQNARPVPMRLFVYDSVGRE